MPAHTDNGGENESVQLSSPAGTDQLLKQALAERERFLKRHPHMKAYQEEIDRVLDKSGTIHDRLSVLEIMMQSNLLEIQKQLYRAALIFGEAVQS